MKNKNITEMATGEIKKELQEDQRYHVNESVEEQKIVNHECLRAEAEFSTNNRRRYGKSSTNGLYQ